MLDLHYFLVSWGRPPPFYGCIIAQVSRSTPPLYRKPRSTKQTFHQKQMSKTTVYKNKPFTKKRKVYNTSLHQKAFSKKTVYKTSLSPKSILHENGLQNKPFTKEHAPRKWSTKQIVHQKTKRGLQNKPFTKKHSP